MEPIMPIMEYVKAQFGCTFRDAEQIANRLADGGFRLGMLAAGSIGVPDLITLGGLAPFEATALLSGAASLPACPPEGGKLGDVLSTMSNIVRKVRHLDAVSDLRTNELADDMSHLNAARNGVFAADRGLKEIDRQLDMVVDMVEGGDEPPAPDDPGASDGEAYYNPTAPPYRPDPPNTYHNPHPEPEPEPTPAASAGARSPKRARSD
jgi:hypothetical protein